MNARIEFEATLITDEGNGAWVYAVARGAAEVFGTRRAIKTVGTIDGTPVEVTLLPLGGGTHMLPVKAATRRAIEKSVGDVVHVQLQAHSAVG